MISNRAAAPEQIRKFKLGACLRSIMAIHQAMTDMGMDKDDLILQQKHIIMTALMDIDMNSINDDNIKYNRIANNSPLLYTINGSYNALRKQIIDSRIRFNRGETLKLYEENRFESKQREICPQIAWDHMDNFLESTTSPSPNTYLTSLTPDPKTGIKRPHVYHFCDVTFEDKNQEWKVNVQPLLNDMNLRTAPCNTRFQERRRKFHPYIYPTPQADHSHCGTHFNFKQKNKTLVSIFSH